MAAPTGGAAGIDRAALEQFLIHEARLLEPLLHVARGTGESHAPVVRIVVAPAALLLETDEPPCPLGQLRRVGVRVVALYGSQNATIWRPLGEGHTVLQTPLPCACLPDAPTPCVKNDSYRSYCVRKLSEDEVFAAVAAALKP